MAKKVSQSGKKTKKTAATRRGSAASPASARKKTAASKKAASKKVAKKTVSKTAVTKKAVTKKAAAKKAPTKQAVTKKATSKKTTTKKTVTKKTVTKTTVAKKTSSKKATAKKTTKKATATTKKSAAKKAPVTKKAPSKTTTTKKAATTKPTKKAATTSGSAKGTAAKAGAAGAPAKPARKGITIVEKRPVRKSKSKTGMTGFPPASEQMLGGGRPTRRRPMIPTAEATDDQDAGDAKGRRRKSSLTKKQIDGFRETLLAKRAALVGDVRQLETDALSGSGGGGSSNTPQHIAEQGSDSYEQSLSLDIAAADRRLLKEVDDALTRIGEGTYGVCELTGTPISLDRLKELPWARYSIEAARQLERRTGH